MKVLILAYDFPPNKSIGGARPESWFLQMPDFGCKPTVITRVWESPLNNPSDTVRKTTIQEKRISRSEERTLIEVPFQPRLRDRLLSKYGHRKYVAIRKALSFIHKVTDFYFLPNVYQSIYDAALEELEDNDYDIIIATGEPFLLFKIASKLSCKTKLPWIADYRDCWTGSRVYENFSNLDTLLSKLLAERHEKHIVSTATCITTPSPSYKRDIKKIFPDKSVNVVYNGFFEEKVNLKNLTLKQSEEVFQIAYIGILYPHQRLELFLDSLSALAFDRPTARFELIFYGLLFYPDQVDRVKRKKQPQNVIVRFTPKVEYGKLIEELCKANLLLLLSQKGADWLNTKIFDYLLVNRQIILCENDNGILEQIITETRSGKAADSKEDLVCYLKSKHDEFQANGFVTVPNRAEGFSRKAQTKRLCELFGESF